MNCNNTEGQFTSIRLFFSVGMVQSSDAVRAVGAEQENIEFVPLLKIIVS